MNQQLLILVVRLIALILILLLLWSAWRIIKRTPEEDHNHPRHRGSALDKNAPLPPSETDNWDIQSTKPLTDSYFGKSLNAPLPQELPDEPYIDLPLTIMARHGQRFSGEDLQNLINTFGLQRAPQGIYELINQNGRDILFSVLNIHAPGTFDNELENMPPIDGIMLVLQLPNGTDALKSFETFQAMTTEMCEQLNGRLCDHKRQPIGPRDLLLYRTAAEQFQSQYNHWLAQHQRNLTR